MSDRFEVSLSPDQLAERTALTFELYDMKQRSRAAGFLGKLARPRQTLEAMQTMHSLRRQISVINDIHYAVADAYLDEKELLIAHGFTEEQALRVIADRYGCVLEPEQGADEQPQGDQNLVGEDDFAYFERQF